MSVLQKALPSEKVTFTSRKQGAYIYIYIIIIIIIIIIVMLYQFIFVSCFMSLHKKEIKLGLKKSCTCILLT